MFYKMWRQEFHFKAFSLNYDLPEHFTRCQWQKAERVIPLWIVYRAIMAAYFLASFLFTLIPVNHDASDESFKKYLIFLTHWTYILETVYFQLGLILVAVKAYKENGKSVESMAYLPWHYKLYWGIYTVVLPGALVVTVIFWAAVYDPEYFPLTIGNLLVHAFNSLFLIVELVLVAHPTKFLHFYWPLFYAFSYVLFSVIYQLSGGTGLKGMIPIYSILDWRYPGSALLTCLFATIFLIVLHTVLAFVHIIKVWIKKKLHSAEE